MATPPITRSSADRAGRDARRYLSGELDLDRDALMEVIRRIGRWRASHTYPLSLVTPGVRNWVTQEMAGRIVVGQRLKRFDRVVVKLGRFPSMRLTQMEDIGGCRAVLLKPKDVEASLPGSGRGGMFGPRATIGSTGSPVLDTAPSISSWPGVIA